MHKSESPPFYHLFDIPALFCLGSQGSWVVFQVCNKHTSVQCCNSFSTTTSTSKPLSLPYDACVCQWLREKNMAFFILELLSGLRRFVGAVLTCLGPGEHIAQIFSMRPHNRSNLLHKELSRPGDMTVGMPKGFINSLSQLV